MSYCRADAEWLRRFEVMLKPEVRNRGIEVWSDTLIEPSRRWRAEIDDAIARADVALLLVTADFLASDFIMDVELATLIERGVPLVAALLRKCRYGAVAELAGVQWAHDPGRDGPVAVAADVDGAIVQVTDALMAVVDGLADRRVAVPEIGDEHPENGVRAPALDVARVAGALDEVPAPPLGFVAREELEDLRSVLLGAGEGALAITGAVGLGLHGQGGIGKTVLAATLARDVVVRRHFPDGVFWVTLGEAPDLVASQIGLIERLGGSGDDVRTTIDGAPRVIGGDGRDRLWC